MSVEREMADEMDRRDAEAGERDSIADRTAAAVMRSNGASEERVVRIFGYSPTPLDGPDKGEA